MQFVYDPFIVRRIAEGRIFICNSKMPFELFVDCFYREQPFFLVSQLEDGRVSIIPNMMFFPKKIDLVGFGSWNLLPTECEYVTIKNGTYPLILTAHPVKEFDVWLRKLQTQLVTFARQSLWEFIDSTMEFEPLRKLPARKIEHELVTT